MPEDQEDRLFGKFEVRRSDGVEDKPNARYFVLDYVNDPSARIALATYAAACRDFWPGLSQDLLKALEETDDPRAIAEIEEQRRARLGGADQPLTTEE